MVAFSVLNIVRLHDACGKSFNALKLLLLKLYRFNMVYITLIELNMFMSY